MYRTLFISLWLFICGFCWFYSLSQDDLNNAIYISENNLIVGVVDEKYNQNSYYYINNLIKQMQSRDNNGEETFTFLKNEFFTLGLEVYSQNFTFNNPSISKTPLHGKNLFAILRSPSGQHAESIVLTAPLRSWELAPKGSYAAYLALAKHLSEQVYWAKDLVFLFLEMDYIGLQAWLDAYHGTYSSKFIEWKELDGRGGSIQASINTELYNFRIDELEIALNGINGLMPNLDLFSTIFYLSRKHGVHVMLNGQSSKHAHSLNRFGNLAGFTTAIYKQSSGSPSSLHGLFLKYQIPAMTIQDSKRFEREQISHSLVQIVKILEGSLRSLNNLQERLHQSFYFYLLPNVVRYVSIGVYFPPFVLLLLSIIPEILTVLLSKTGRNELFINNWTSAILSLIYSILISSIATNLTPNFAILLSKHFEMSYNFSILVASFFVTLFLPFIGLMISLLYLFLSNHTMNARVTLPFINFLWIILLSCIATMNISMAFVLASIICPCLIVLNSKWIFFRIFALPFLFLTSPVVLFGIGCVINRFFNLNTTKSIVDVHQQFINVGALFDTLLLIIQSIDSEELGRLMLQLLLESQVLESFTWTIAFGPYFAIWNVTLLTWILSDYHFPLEEKSNKKKVD